jgi:putative zinc finger/helix-turn-helix YgiT family protein
MNEKLITLPSIETRVCDECGGYAVQMSFKDDRFFYGSGTDAVELTARVPVWTCDKCGHAYTEGDAEDLRHEVVCRHLGVLSPTQVRAVREKYGMSQSEFAKATGFGLASVKRWETGALIQNQSTDRLLRLLATDRSIIGKLAGLEISSTRIGAIRPVFRTQITDEIRAEAAVFELRLASM